MTQILINEIIQQMLPYLNNAQEDKLQTVLRKVLSRYEVVEGNEKHEQELDYHNKTHELRGAANWPHLVFDLLLPSCNFLRDEYNNDSGI